MMGGVSVFVIAKNRRLLGQSVPDSKDAVVELLLRDEAVMRSESTQQHDNAQPFITVGSLYSFLVRSCQDVKAVRIHPGVCRFKAEIQFNSTTYEILLKYGVVSR